MKQNKPSWNIIEFLTFFCVSLITGICYQKFSSGIWFGQNAYAGSCILVVLSSIAVSSNTNQFSNALIRVISPALFVYLFYSASDTSGGIISSLQMRLGLPHFILVFISALISIHLTQDKKIEEKKKVVEKEKKIEPKPVVDPFERIIGQEHVTKSLRQIAQIAKSGIRVGKRNAPHAVLLFLGPTGVGKTEAAMALAEAVFGSKEAMIRFDMGQFNDASQANRFYGPPPGYVGYEEGGQLTRAVLKKPKSVVLLDEMEKANSQIWDAFLPVFDEGYIVDGSTNQKVDMTNTVIVLTSNLLAGTANLTQLSKFEVKEKVEALGILRPELLGRINEILVFNPLTREAILEILQRRLDASLWSLSEQGIRITVGTDTVNKLFEEVQRAKFGVRQIDDVVRAYLREQISSQTGQDSL